MKLKKKLLAAGLPNVNYIELRNGIFYWTPEIPVLEDAREFERLYALAQEEKNINNIDVPTAT